MSAEPRWLTEADVADLVDLPGAIGAVDAVLRAEATGSARTLAKTALTWGGSHTVHSLGGVIDATEIAGGIAGGIVGVKSWAHTAGGAAPLLTLWRSESGELLAVIEAFALGQLRTASISAVATGALSIEDASTMAMIGTGKQALAQVAAVVAQRQITRINVFSPTAERRAAFCASLGVALPHVEVVECTAVDDAVAGADVVTTATRSSASLLTRAQLSAHAHVNALGAITRDRRELDDTIAAGARVVVADCPDVALALSHELDRAAEVRSLSSVLVDDARSATHDAPSLFKAMGLGLADVAVGAAVLAAAVAAGRGAPLPPRTRAQPHLFVMTSQPQIRQPQIRQPQIRQHGSHR